MALNHIPLGVSTGCHPGTSDRQSPDLPLIRGQIHCSKEDSSGDPVAAEGSEQASVALMKQHRRSFTMDHAA